MKFIFIGAFFVLGCDPSVVFGIVRLLEDLLKKKNRSHKNSAENVEKFYENQKRNGNSKKKNFHKNKNASEENKQQHHSFTQQKKFRNDKWNPGIFKDPLQAFDSYLESKIGAENLQKHADQAKKKINLLVSGELSAAEMGMGITHHGEKKTKFKHIK